MAETDIERIDRKIREEHEKWVAEEKRIADLLRGEIESDDRG